MIYKKINENLKEVIRGYIKKDGILKKVLIFLKKNGQMISLFKENYLIYNGSGRNATINFGNNFDITENFVFRAKFKMGQDRYIPYLEKGFSKQAQNSYMIFGGYFENGKIQISKNDPSAFSYESVQELQPNSFYTRELKINNSNCSISCNDTTFNNSYGSYNSGNKFTQNAHDCIMNFMSRGFRLYKFTIGGKCNGVYKEYTFDLASDVGKRYITSTDGKLKAYLGEDINCIRGE